MARLWRLTLVALHIASVSCASAAGARQQSGIWPGFGAPEPTLESLNLAPEDIVTVSPEPDASAEASALANSVSSAPRPFNVVVLSDSPSEIEKLQSDVDSVLRFTAERQRDAQQLGEPPSDTAAKPPMSPSLAEPLASVVLTSAHYQLYTSSLATLAVFLLAVPLACKLLSGGRTLARQHIPLVNTFAVYFLTFNALHPLVGPGLLHSAGCMFAAYSAHGAVMRPLRILRLFPRSIRKEPIGWVFEVVCVCGVMANVVYRVVLALLRQLAGGSRLPHWLSSWLPLLYAAHMLLASAGVLTAMIKAVPTFFAQELVFAWASLYIILAGLSYVNDLLVYTNWLGNGLIAVDPTVFFAAAPMEHVGSELYMGALCVGSAYVAASFGGGKAGAGTGARAG